MGDAVDQERHMRVHMPGLRPFFFLVGVSALAVSLEAQGVRWSLGGGATIPVGDYGRADKTGWHVMGAAFAPVAIPNLALRLDALYSETTHKGFSAGHTKLGGGGASVLWRLRREGPDLRPYLITGLGFYGVSVTATAGGSTSKSGVAWSGGGGLSFLGLGPAIAFVEARFITIRTPQTPTNLFPLSVGFVLGSR
jgi:hypothetical protein